MPGERPINVLIAQNTWVHYTEGLVRALRENPKAHVSFLHDPNWTAANGVDSIPPLDSTVLVDEIVAPIRPLGPVKFQWGLASCLRSKEYDAVVLEGDPLNLANWVVLASAALARPRIPTLVWTHGWSRRDPALRAFVKRRFFGLASRVLLYSRRAIQIGVEEGHDPHKLIYLGNSLPQPAIVPDPAGNHGLAASTARTPGDDGTAVNIITVTRLTKDRELDQLLAAMIDLRNRGVSARLSLVGEGEARPGLQEISESFDLDVWFVGAIYDPSELAALYSRADVSVVTGRAGLAVAQALYHGAPVIAHNDLSAQMPEVAAIRPGVCGEFFERGNHHDLADKIEMVARGRAMGAYSATACRAVADDEFSPARQAERMIDAIVASVENPR